MQACLSRVIALAVLASGHTAVAATLFEDGFEQGLGAWTVAATNQGRALASTDHAPASGNYHLVLDDAVNDSTYSVAEASITLDLSFKKNVVLQFKAKSLGNESNPPPTENFTTVRTHDAVAISTDGGVTWRSVQSLAAIGTTWTSYVIPLEAAITQLGGNLSAGFRIRFSAYDNSPAPLDGIAIDDVIVTADSEQRAVVELPGPVNEGGGPYTGQVMVFSAPDTPLTLELFTAPGSPLMLPPFVTVPPGATSVSFPYTVEEDTSVTLTRTVSVYAYAAGIVATAGSVEVIDNDVPVVALTLPATLKEGETPTDNATLSFDPAPSIPVVLQLASNPGNELSLPGTVTVPAGQNQVSFTARAVNDTKIDGDIPVVVTVSAAGMTPVSASTIATDNETRTLTLTIPDTIKEGANGNASVALNGVLSEPLVVSLALVNSPGVTIPASVTLPAGSGSVGFTITTADNTVRDGTRTFPLQATADGFAVAMKNVVVKDNDIASYRFSTFTDIMNLGTPVSMTIQPVDIEGTVITGLSGAVNLALVSADGSTQPVSPASVNFTSSTWSGSVTMPAIHGTGLRLRASDAGGYSGTSTPFDAMRTLTMKASDLVWNPARNVIYASVAANDTTANANKVVAIDPVTLQVTGSTATGQDPRRLLLTPDGQYLYVSLFGNGSIGKINPATMQLISTVAMGSDPNYGALYAEDMCAVAGQPDTLIVSQARKSSTFHVAVAVYDNGVQRPQKALYGSSNEIEPTADASFYVGYETDSTSFETNRLQLNADGMAILATKKSVIDGFATDFQSQGNAIFAGNGKMVDATTLEPTGTFPTSGPMRAELAANRVFFLEKTSLSGSYFRIAAFDPTTHALVRRASTPTISDSGVGRLIRWGNNGLAFKSDTAVRIVSTSLVVSGGPADLKVNMEATPDTVAVGTQMTYTVHLTNQGPGTALGAELTATLSSGQTLDFAAANLGTPVIAGSVVKLAAGDLAAGASVTLTLKATPLADGNPSCQVTGLSRTVDPDGTDNVDVQFARVGFPMGPDKINTLRLVAKSMIYDEGRKVLWCTIPSTEAPPLGKSLISIDPLTGVISAPIPLGADPMENSIALSGNHRYLYVGLSDIRHLCRIDLQANPPEIVTVPLAVDDSGNTGFATDIAVLEGDGKSVVVCTTGDRQEVNVIDDLTRRTPGNLSISADHIEPTGTPGGFIALNTQTSSSPVYRLQVGPGGLTVLDNSFRFFNGNPRIQGEGDNLLSSDGYLADSSNLTLKLNLGVSGSPWLEVAKNRAYIVNGNTLRSFDTTTGLPAASLALPTTATGDWSLSCTRWGSDGMAILGGDGTLQIIRWSELGSADEDQDGVSDAWENEYFGSLDSNLAADDDHDGLPSVIEYLYGISPRAGSMDPLKTSVRGIPDTPTMVLEFPRRSGLANSYRIQGSVNLENWADVAGVVETITAIQTVGGVTTETIRAEIPMTDGLHYARIKWIGP